MRVVLSLVVFGLALVAVVPVACDTTNCKTGTIAAEVFLRPPINDDADRVTVTSIDPPGLDVAASVSRTPGTTGSIFVDLSFPHGYPANTIVTIYAQAFAGPVRLGEGQAVVHTASRCSELQLPIGPLAPLVDPDAGQ
jgi:hypothetical protein